MFILFILFILCYSIFHPFVVPLFIFSDFFLHLCLSSGQSASPDLTLHCLPWVILPTCVQLLPHRFLGSFLIAVEGDSFTATEGGWIYNSCTSHRSMMFLKLKQLSKFRAVLEQIIFQSNCGLNRNCFMSITFKHPGTERATGNFLLAAQSSQKRYHFLSQGKTNFQLFFFHCSILIQTSSSECHSVSKSREGSSGSRNNGLYQKVFLGSHKHARHLRNISCLHRAVLSVCSDTLHILRLASNQKYMEFNEARLDSIPWDT